MPRLDTNQIEQLNILDLIQQDVPLSKAANTDGGEYAGPCPFCNEGEDRFRVWPNHPSGRGRYWCRQCDRKGDAIQYVSDRHNLSFVEALAVLFGEAAPPASRPRPDTPKVPPKKEEPTPPHTTKQVVARYTYTDERGTPLYQVQRVHLLDEAGQRVGKRFIQYRHTAEGLQAGLADTRRVIYRLPEIKAAAARGDVVFLVEGEKCVHSLTTLGLQATTVPMGANGWKPDYLEAFVGAKVIIIPDNDEPGLAFARTAAEDLFPHCEWVKICDLPHLPPGGDIHDWLEMGHTIKDLEAYINSCPIWLPMPDFEIGKYLENDTPDLSEVVPPLPDDATGAWMDQYVAYAEKIAPLSPRSFHESAALWLVSVMLARRLAVKTDFGKIFPNLFIAWVADTTMWTKSTALDIARDAILEAAPHLLAPEETTHEAMLSDMAGARPVNMRMDDPDMALDHKMWMAERNFAAQRSILLDEMSGLLASAGKDYNGGLLEALMRFYDCTRLYRRSTRGQGRLTIRDAYMSFIGSSTPAALSKHLTAPELWNNGWWPRFALIAPEEDNPVWRDTTPTERNPAHIIDKLTELDAALPQPEWPDTPDPLTVPTSESAMAMWKRYSKAMRHTKLIEAKQGKTDLDQRLYGSYGRLPTMALKVATLLAVMDWNPADDLPRVEANHMARAIHIIEGWRKSIHRLMAKIAQSTYDETRQQILRKIAHYGSKGASSRDLHNGIRGIRPDYLESMLNQMMIAGDIFTYRYQPAGGGRPSDKYLSVEWITRVMQRDTTVEITLPPPLNDEEDAFVVINLKGKKKGAEPTATIKTVAEVLGIPSDEVDLDAIKAELGTVAQLEAGKLPQGAKELLQQAAPPAPEPPAAQPEPAAPAQPTAEPAPSPEAASPPPPEEVTAPTRAPEGANVEPAPPPDPEPPRPISEMSSAERLRWRKQQKNRARRTTSRRRRTARRDAPSEDSGPAQS